MTPAAASAAEVRAETRQPVMDDVRVRVVEAGQHAGPGEVDHASPRVSQPHELRSAGRNDSRTGDGKVGLRPEAGASERPDATASEDQVSSQATARLSAWR